MGEYNSLSETRVVLKWSSFVAINFGHKYKYVPMQINFMRYFFSKKIFPAINLVEVI
jgi:hypothetical protein